MSGFSIILLTIPLLLDIYLQFLAIRHSTAIRVSEFWKKNLFEQKSLRMQFYKIVLN